jgi:hypothetical protein
MERGPDRGAPSGALRPARSPRRDPCSWSRRKRSPRRSRTGRTRSGSCAAARCSISSVMEISRTPRCARGSRRRTRPRGRVSLASGTEGTRDRIATTGPWRRNPRRARRTIRISGSASRATSRARSPRWRGRASRSRRGSGCGTRARAPSTRRAGVSTRISRRAGGDSLAVTGTTPGAAIAAGESSPRVDPLFARPLRASGPCVRGSREFRRAATWRTPRSRRSGPSRVRRS